MTGAQDLRFPEVDPETHLSLIPSEAMKYSLDIFNSVAVDCRVMLHTQKRQFELRDNVNHGVTVKPSMLSRSVSRRT